MPTIYQRVGSSLDFTKQNSGTSYYRRTHIFHSKPTIREQHLGIGCPDNCYVCRRMSVKSDSTSAENQQDSTVSNNKAKAYHQSTGKSKKSTNSLNIIGRKSLQECEASCRCLPQSTSIKNKYQRNVYRKGSNVIKEKSPKEFHSEKHSPVSKLPKMDGSKLPNSEINENSRFRCIDPKENNLRSRRDDTQVCEGEDIKESSHLVYKKRLILRIDMSALRMVDESNVPGRSYRRGMVTMPGKQKKP